MVFGFRNASLYNVSAARCVRRMTKSNDGPISSTSTRGVFEPDFLSSTLQEIIHSVQIFPYHSRLWTARIVLLTFLPIVCSHSK